MKILSVLLSVSIVFTAITGDYIVFHSKYSKFFIFRAVIDNFVHASIGTLSALLFFIYVERSRQAWIYNIILCTIVSSLIDVDHFIVAKSIHYKDLTNLKYRGFLHCTSLWFIITTILLIYSYIFRKNNIYVLSYMLILAYTSHHIRDGNRRGLCVYPFGHTPPIHKYVYVLLLGILPIIFGHICQYMKPISKNTVVQYSMLV
ncbi:transmembrane protein 267 [Pieris rapae]|uniref:transmembrane protein 267 n=1 Tax=Pieris rapae TaxID=64459 RepID=UPI001E27AF0B|nr:transmembrane protein 267 [Pieris rapae]